VWWPAWHDIRNICSGNHDYTSADDLQLKPVSLVLDKGLPLYLNRGPKHTSCQFIVYSPVTHWISIKDFGLVSNAHVSSERDKNALSLNSVILTYMGFVVTTMKYS
jgi:hypothetical protein